MITVLVDGAAYGMLLFVMGVGLAITLGLMRFVHLSHGVFAMVGGYAAVWAATQWGWGLVAVLLFATVCSALLGWLLERVLYKHYYTRPPLDQVLLSLGVIFIAVAVATYFFGPRIQPFSLPPVLQQSWSLGGVSVSVYRLLIILIGVVVFAMLHGLFHHTLFGAKVRAAVDNPKVAQGLGIQVPLLFTATFVLSSALAGFGGALSLGLLALEPHFAIHYLVFFLMVVCVGGAGSLKGPLVAALLLGITDALAKYYAPAVGSFFIYVLMIGLLVWRPNGLVSAHD